MHNALNLSAISRSIPPLLTNRAAKLQGDHNLVAELTLCVFGRSDTKEARDSQGARFAICDVEEELFCTPEHP
jgi:hypothetical protein